MSDCVICLDRLTHDLAALDCGHVFHEACVKSWIARRSSCPTCKAVVRKKRYVKLFLDARVEEPQTGADEALPDDAAKLREIAVGLKGRVKVLETAVHQANATKDRLLQSRQAAESAVLASKDEAQRSALQCREVKARLRGARSELLMARSKQEVLTNRLEAAESHVAAAKLAGGNDADVEELNSRLRSTGSADQARTLAVTLLRSHKLVAAQLKEAGAATQRAKRDVEKQKRKFDAERMGLHRELSNLRRELERASMSAARRVGASERRSAANDVCDGEESFTVERANRVDDFGNGASSASLPLPLSQRNCSRVTSVAENSSSLRKKGVAQSKGAGSSVLGTQWARRSSFLRGVPEHRAVTMRDNGTYVKGGYDAYGRYKQEHAGVAVKRKRRVDESGAAAKKIVKAGSMDRFVTREKMG